MNGLRGLPFAIAGLPLISRLFSPSSGGLTTVLYHGFFFGDESRGQARERLRRQLGWLSRAYNPLTLAQFQTALLRGEFPPRSLLVTVDDAKLDLLKVYEEFQSFGVPLAVYVCAGWTEQASEIEPDGLLARVVATLEWYEGPDVALSIGSERRSVMIGRSYRNGAIDQILTSRWYYEPHLEEILSGLRRTTGSTGPRAICTWSELEFLRDRGAQFGSHSVSHIRLAPASDVRLQFEVCEAKRLVDRRKLGPCSSFAYPYGVDGTCDERTTAVLQAAGLTDAFMTHPGFTHDGALAFHLPRFALPERHMTDAEYRGRVRGGGVFLRKLKNALRPSSSSS